MAGGTAKQRAHYWALLALTTLGKGYLSAKTWPDRDSRFNWTVSLALIVAGFGFLFWWNPTAIAWVMGGGFCWIQVMGIGSEEENARLRKEVERAGIADKCRSVFNRLDRWLLDGCLSAAGQQRLKAAGLACTLPAAHTKGFRPRF